MTRSAKETGHVVRAGLVGGGADRKPRSALVFPPQMPSRAPIASAYDRQSSRTLQPRQMLTASATAAGAGR